MNKIIKYINTSLCMFLGLIGISFAESKPTPASMKIDHRGLLEIPGVLKTVDNATWGAANLVVFGPGWAYSAQDYACKGAKGYVENDPKSVSYSGKMNAGSAKLNVDELITDVSADGKNLLKIVWKISSQDETPMKLESAFISLPLAVSEFANSVVAGGVLPVEYSAEYIPNVNRNPGEITIEGVGKKLHLNVIKGAFSVRDARKEKNSRYELRIEFPNVKNATSSEVEFVIGATFLNGASQGNIALGIPKPPFFIKEGEDWVEFPYVNGTKEGSILDFSNQLPHHAPAGKFGPLVVDVNGHFVCRDDKSRRVKLVGPNVCFSANFISKERVDNLVAEFRKFGFNAIRFHHTDVLMMQGGWGKDYWNKTKREPIDPEQLDKLDYFFYKCKEAGIYVTFDLYSMGVIGMVEGVEKSVFVDIKALVPIHKPAFEAWGKTAMDWMNHVNPYTGIAWKNDPAIVTVCPLNEDSIVSAWGRAKDKYDKAFAEWKTTLPEEDLKKFEEKQLLIRFLTEVKVKSNKEIEKFLRDNGVTLLISGSNWFDTMAQTYERESLEVVDNHMYADHPVDEKDPSVKEGKNTRYNNKSTMRDTVKYMVPLMKAATRIYGKPFILTEYNFCAPNYHRSEAGAMMGAYASLQDWDGLYRFAWAHDEGLLNGQHRIKGFDVVCDPVGQMTERQVLLMYGRGDVASAKDSYVYGVTLEDAIKDGPGDMWFRGLFPDRFYEASPISKIGSQVIDDGRKIDFAHTAVTAAKPIDEAKLAGNTFKNMNELPKCDANGVFVSDTGEISLNKKAGNIRINTEKTACIASQAKESLTAGPLSVKDGTTFASVSVSAMDDKSLVDSSKVLMFYITDVTNTNIKFKDSSRMRLLNWGTLPYLARRGSINVSFKSNVEGMTLYALNSIGERIREIPTTYENGEYSFSLEIGKSEETPSMIYEFNK